MKIAAFIFFLCACVCFSSITHPIFHKGPSENVYGLERSTPDAETDFLILSDVCQSKATWYSCPAGSGTHSKSTKAPDCCPGKSDWYCPTGNQECASGGCCPDGFGISCSLGEKKWCCSSNSPICGYDGGCYTGSCSCGVCNGVDSCQFESCGDTCTSCCNMYDFVCKGPATCKSSAGFIGIKTTHAETPCYPFEERPIPGRFYFVKSKFGNYLDLIHDPKAEMRDAFAITETHKNENRYALDSFLVQLIDHGDGYYMIKSKFGRYLYMTDSKDTLPAWSTSEMWKNTQKTLDSFLIQLIDNGDGYYMLKSKSGRYLDLRQEKPAYFIGGSYQKWEACSISKSWLDKKFTSEKDSFVMKFQMVEKHEYTSSMTVALGSNGGDVEVTDSFRSGQYQLKLIKIRIYDSKIMGIQVTTDGGLPDIENPFYGCGYCQDYQFIPSGKISSVSVCYDPSDAIRGLRFNYVGGTSSQDYGSFTTGTNGTIPIDGEIIGVYGRSQWYHGPMFKLGFIVSKKQI